LCLSGECEEVFGSGKRTFGFRVDEVGDVSFSERWVDLEGGAKLEVD
jgi:hypothetical protein